MLDFVITWISMLEIQVSGAGINSYLAPFLKNKTKQKQI